MKRKRPRIAFLMMLVVVLIFSATIYLGRSYKADAEALSVYEMDDIVVTKTSYGIEVSAPTKENQWGFLIYPGAQIEPEAYLPLARETALRFKATAVIVDFPLNFAFFDWKIGKKAMDALEIDNWILIGHSLGGAFGSKLANQDERIAGLVMLASYPADNLSKSGLPVISLNAQLDAVMTEAEFNKKREKFPANTEFYVIGGANHSQFGSYGLMAEDSVASISAQKQREIVLDFMEDWLSSLR